LDLPEDSLRAFLSAAFSTEQQFHNHVAKIGQLERQGVLQLAASTGANQ